MTLNARRPLQIWAGRVDNTSEAMTTLEGRRTKGDDG